MPVHVAFGGTGPGLAAGPGDGSAHGGVHGAGGHPHPGRRAAPPDRRPEWRARHLPVPGRQGRWLHRVAGDGGPPDRRPGGGAALRRLLPRRDGTATPPGDDDRGQQPAGGAGQRTGGPGRRPGTVPPRGRGGQPSQVGIPGQHEPRNPHAHERRHGHDPDPAGNRPDL
ncbi:hypothetical protein AZA_90348 [Nitrospirillum viridazoti Y2]|nr:hypothetical protein AZA_90348 [Nitrospirillum amazonense Y2]